jgi:hypothetical protein
MRPHNELGKGFLVRTLVGHTGGVGSFSSLQAGKWLLSPGWVVLLCGEWVGREGLGRWYLKVLATLETNAGVTCRILRSIMLGA